VVLHRLNLHAGASSRRVGLPQLLACLSRFHSGRHYLLMQENPWPCSSTILAGIARPPLPAFHVCAPSPAVDAQETESIVPPTQPLLVAVLAAPSQLGCTDPRARFRPCRPPTLARVCHVCPQLAESPHAGIAEYGIPAGAVSLHTAAVALGLQTMTASRVSPAWTSVRLCLKGSPPPNCSPGTSTRCQCRCLTAAVQSGLAAR
jgi:hypothetical protein